jgi:flavodoxin
MSERGLIAYATRYGSTEEVAEKIGQIFDAIPRLSPS